MSFPPYSKLKIFIDLIFISIILNEDLSSILISHNSIICTKYRHHKTIPTRWSFILMELSLSITYLIFNLIIINYLIKEDNQKVKEIIKINHIQPFIYYFSWALTNFFILSILTFCITGNISFNSHIFNNLIKYLRHQHLVKENITIYSIFGINMFN